MEKSISLQFGHLFNDTMQWGFVDFETESPQRNLLMRVQMGDYSLDTCDLRTDHPKLYAELTNTMRTKAQEYWEKEVAHVN